MKQENNSISNFFYYFIAFVANFCLMTLEIVAGRMIAPYLGVSIYTWTSVIGIVLAGLSLGAFGGGYLADRPDKIKTTPLLSWALLIAGITSAMSLFWVNNVLGPFFDSAAFSLPLAALILSAAAFFLPSFFLGMITPVLIKIVLKETSYTGRIAGKIYGLGAAGSIFGTFATGFLFISFFGTKQIIIGIAVALFLLSLLNWIFVKLKMPPKIAVSMIILSLALLPFLDSPPCLKESRYYCISITHQEGNRYVLALDELEHSKIYPGEPQHLGDGYQQIFALLVSYSQKQHSKDSEILFLGGGGYVLPRFLEKFFPGVRQEVVEIDPAVTSLVRAFAGPIASPVIHRDARVYVNQLSPDKKYDLVIGDVFQDYSVPYQLTTMEFAGKIKSHLTDGGIYAVNVVDSYQNAKFLASMVRTLEGVFPFVEIIAFEDKWRARSESRTTYVIVAQHEKFDEKLWGALKKEKIHPSEFGNVWPVPRDEVEIILGRGKILTDNFAPVEKLLANIYSLQ